MACGTGGDGEGFVDVPDEVVDIRVASRGAAELVLEWRLPCDNSREITHFQLFAERWSTDVCGTLPPQEADSLPEDAARQHLLLEISAADAAAAAVVAGAGPGCCRCRFEAPDWLRTHASACWVAVRAWNAEGWAEWSAPLLVLFRRPAEAGRLHTWGAADDGRLGRGLAAVERRVCAEPGAVEAPAPQALSLGAHTALVSGEDQLYVWGTFLAGDDTAPPDAVDLLTEPAQQATPFVPHDVACGRFVTAVLSADGRLFAWGANEEHQCGVRGGKLVRSLHELELPRRVPIVRVALGEFHGLALTALGEVLAWGLDQGPEVNIPSEALRISGLPERASLNQPVPRAVELPHRVAEIFTGAYHSAAITEEGLLWTWGSNDHGQLGHGSGVPPLFRPKLVEALHQRGEAPQQRVVAASLGGFHSCAIVEGGAVFAWGANSKGQCGHGDAAIVDRPLRVEFASPALRCLAVSCGGLFTYFKMCDGSARPQFYACGLGKEGCLGFGQPCKRMSRPRPLPSPTKAGAAGCEGMCWTHIEAGMAHVAGLAAAVAST